MPYSRTTPTAAPHIGSSGGDGGTGLNTDRGYYPDSVHTGRHPSDEGSHTTRGGEYDEPGEMHPPPRRRVSRSGPGEDTSRSPPPPYREHVGSPGPLTFLVGNSLGLSADDIHNVSHQAREIRGRVRSDGWRSMLGELVEVVGPALLDIRVNTRHPFR